jgi:hypothetical protein
MPITVKDLKTIKADLVRRRKARLTVIDDRDLSVKETILRLAPELRRMKKRGFTTIEMIEALKENGLNIKGATLNRYLAEGQPPKVSSAKGQRKCKAGAPSSAQESDEVKTISALSGTGNGDLLSRSGAIT